MDTTAASRATAAIVAALVTVGAGMFAIVRAVATSDDLALSPAPTATDDELTTDATTDATTDDGVVVEISGFEFLHDDLVVPAGTEVTWINRDSQDHAVFATDRSFSSPLIGTDGSFTMVFDTPGEFDYICSIHPTMTATITVEA